MKKLLMVLALVIPLMAQEAESKEEAEKAFSNLEKETTTQKVVRHIQDTEWRKFQAAHRRAHYKRGEHSGREFKKHKRGWVSKAVGVVVIGGIGYYIGVNDRKYRKDWDKRRYGWSDRK